MFGCCSMTISSDAGDTHPAALVTVKVKVPGGMFDTVRVVPEPGIVRLPGERVRVHDPVAGSPLS